MKKIIAIIITGICLAMMLLTWRQPGFAAWAIALAGWIQIAFARDERDNHGDA